MSTADRLASSEQSLADTIRQAAARLDAVGTSDLQAALADLARAQAAAEARLAAAAQQVLRSLGDVAAMAEGLAADLAAQLLPTVPAPASAPAIPAGEVMVQQAACSPAESQVPAPLTPVAVATSAATASDEPTVDLGAPIADDDADALPVLPGDDVVDLGDTTPEALDRHQQEADAAGQEVSRKTGKLAGKRRGRKG